MPNDFRNCCHYRFNHSIYERTGLNNGNAAESAEIHCYYVTIQRRNDTDIIFRLDDIICNHRRNEQCVEARRNGRGGKKRARKELAQSKKKKRETERG